MNEIESEIYNIIFNEYYYIEFNDADRIIFYLKGSDNSNYKGFTNDQLKEKIQYVTQNKINYNLLNLKRQIYYKYLNIWLKKGEIEKHEIKNILQDAKNYIVSEKSLNFENEILDLILNFLQKNNYVNKETGKKPENKITLICDWVSIEKYIILNDERIEAPYTISEINSFDEYLPEAAQIIVDEQSCSVSQIQRKFAITYKRYGEIIDQLESLGIVGPNLGSNEREVLVYTQQELNEILDNNNILYTTYPEIKDPEPDPEPDPPLPLLFYTLTQVFKTNNKEKLLKTDLIKIYADYTKEHSQDVIEKNINDFLNNNNLIPENDKLQGKTDKEKQCSTNWIVKEKGPLLPKGCGKYFGYGILLTIIGVGIYYFYQYINSGTVYYNISTSANVRSTPNKSSTINAIDALKYGDLFKSKETATGSDGTIWYKSNSWFSDEYVSSKLMVDEKDFHLLESIFGDDVTKNAIINVKPRKAMIDYYKRQSPDYTFFGKIDDPTYQQVYGKPKNFTGVYQVSCYERKKGEYNSIIEINASKLSSKFQDFGFIVTNVETPIKTFVLYAFDDITEDPIYVGEADATGHNLVKSVSVRPNGTLNVIFAD
ncbi:MAG: DNA translocase FtsK [Chitinophagales bacterium]